MSAGLNPKCWMCQSTTLTITETWTGSKIIFNMVNGSIVDHVQDDEPEPYRLDAVCGCGHKWKLRGATQIGDLEANHRYGGM